MNPNLVKLTRLWAASHLPSRCILYILSHHFPNFSPWYRTFILFFLNYWLLPMEHVLPYYHLSSGPCLSPLSFNISADLISFGLSSRLWHKHLKGENHVGFTPASLLHHHGWDGTENENHVSIKIFLSLLCLQMYIYYFWHIKKILIQFYKL